MDKGSRYKKWYWGHSNASPIKSEEYNKEKRKMRNLISANLNHSHIVSATRFLDLWLEKSHQGNKMPYWYLLGRLWEAEIRGQDILIESSAIWMFALNRKGRVLNMDHLSHIVGSKVIRIVPFWGRTRGPEHRGIGEILKRKFKPMYLKLCKTIVEEEAEIKCHNFIMSQSLSI